MSQPVRTLRLGTRGSMLALAQSRLIAEQLQRRHEQLRVELVTIKTTGDRVQDRPLADLGGKGLFVKELEQALLRHEIDFAVHSYKDVPVTMPVVDESNLIIAAVPPREDAGDVLVLGRGGNQRWWEGGRIGTSSLRRRCQLLSEHPSLTVLPLRGNIDTRLRKLREGEFDAIVLAAAGLRRAGLVDGLHVVNPHLVPAAGQGALALQCRRDDQPTAQLLAALHDAVTAHCVDAERELVRRLAGDCHSPIGVWATLEAAGEASRMAPQLKLRSAVGAAGGEMPVIRAEAAIREVDLTAGLARLVDLVEDELMASGVMALLHGHGS